jgi:hypothetical protein
MADALNVFIHGGLSLSAQYTATLFAIDAATDQAEFIFQADEAMTITRLGFRYGARTGTPPLHKISLQGVVDTTGFPDTTIKGGGSPASKTFTPPADTSIDGLWQWHTLDNSYTCTRGELLAIVISYVSDTGGNAVGASHNSTFTVTDSMGLSNGQEGMPYAISNNAGSRSKLIANPCFGYSSATKIYGRPAQAAFASAATTSASTPDEYAMAFTLPTDWLGTYQLGGVILRHLSPASASRVMTIQLYSGTTPLQTVAFPMTVNSTPNTVRTMRYRFTETTLATLGPGQIYRVGFQPDAGSNVFHGVTQASNAEWGAYPLGVGWYTSHRTDAGAWTDLTDTRLLGGLLLKDLSGGGSHFIG